MAFPVADEHLFVKHEEDFHWESGTDHAIQASTSSANSNGEGIALINEEIHNLHGEPSVKHEEDFYWESSTDHTFQASNASAYSSGETITRVKEVIQNFHGEPSVKHEEDWCNSVVETYTISPYADGKSTSRIKEEPASTPPTISTLIDRFTEMGFSQQSVQEAIKMHGEKNWGSILEFLFNNSDETSDLVDSDVVRQLVGMGFTKKLIAKALNEHGETDDMDSIVETLLTYSATMEDMDEQQSEDADSLFSDSSDENFNWDGFKSETSSEQDSDSEPTDTLNCLKKMGYDEDEAALAIERCGYDSSVSELTDFIFAAQVAKSQDLEFSKEKPKLNPEKCRFRRSLGSSRKKKRRIVFRRRHNRVRMDPDTVHFPNPMIGYGVPTLPGAVQTRILPKEAIKPPFFYFENVAKASKGSWQTISEHLYNVEPEFVDSEYFCAAARKRGYVHNLPIHNRYPLLPLQKLSIQDALPLTKKWWPPWDGRTKLGCIQTSSASAKDTERIRKVLEGFNGQPPRDVAYTVFKQCKKMKLVWVGKNKVAPLEPDEVEMLLGFPMNHTRGGGICRTARYKSLGNSFQVDTVAYHLSVLKELFPNGMNVLSLFSGIGGAEVALYKLGIRMKNVVAVEKSELNRSILRSWWEQTEQQGTLIDLPDVRELDAVQLQMYNDRFGGFDLVIGGSPCNNLSGGNRFHRDGLAGTESSLFFDFARILKLVRNMQIKPECDP